MIRSNKQKEDRLVSVCITRKDGLVKYGAITPEEFILLEGGEEIVKDGNGKEVGKITHKRKDYIKSVVKVSKEKELKMSKQTKQLKPEVGTVSTK